MSFRLPNFFADPLLNGLRYEMGASLVGALGPRKAPQLLTEHDLKALEGSGLDIDPSSVKAEADGTLSFRNKRVLLYIRDIGGVRDRYSLPRFHVAYCTTLETMQRDRRFKRYVVATREDGVFHLNLIAEGTPLVERLNVCQCCLARLGWDGFAFSWPSGPRKEAVQGFKIPDFFERYPKDVITVTPDQDADTAPLNDYPDHWGEISERIKRERGYTCEKCLRNMSAHRQYFHAHHINGLKNDCSAANIKLLCVACHADEPMHVHMKSTQAYRTFVGETA